MKTLKSLIIDRKIRKGTAHGTTKRGAYWTLADKPNEYFAILRRSGGDGIGQSAPDVTHGLELRHFRSGEVRAVIVRDAYHQNGSYSSGGTSYHDASAILDCVTVEDVIVALKAAGTEESGSVYSDGKVENLTRALVALGLPVSAPAPDEEANPEAATAEASFRPMPQD